MANPTRGLTLVELIVATGIALIIVGALFSLQISSQRSFVMGDTFLDIHSNARAALDWMTREIRWATQVLPNQTIQGQLYTTDNNTLVLELPSIDADGNIIASTFDNIAYQINGTNLERSIESNGAGRIDGRRTVANNVNTLALSSYGVGLSGIADPSMVEIELTTRREILGMALQETINSASRLRNRR